MEVRGFVLVQIDERAGQACIRVSKRYFPLSLPGAFVTKRRGRRDWPSGRSLWRVSESSGGPISRRMTRRLRPVRRALVATARRNSQGNSHRSFRVCEIPTSTISESAICSSTLATDVEAFQILHGLSRKQAEEFLILTPTSAFPNNIRPL